MTAAAAPAARKAGPERSAPGSAIRPRVVTNQLFISTTTPMAFLGTTKCGSTFLKHLIWHVDTGAVHESGTASDTAIHTYDDVLPRGDRLSVEEAGANPYAFMVVRNPVDRFLSLYYDKVLGPRDSSFAWFRKLLAGIDGMVADPATVDQHRRNVRLTLGWIERNLAGKTERPLNNHWRRQRYRLNLGRTLGLRLLTLDGLNAQLGVLLGDVVPDMDAHIAAVTTRNTTPKPIAKDVLLDEDLEMAIRAVYPRDHRVWTEARAAWDAVDMSRPDPDAVPRLRKPYV